MNLVRFFVLCLIILSIAAPANSQVTVVPSTTKITIDGKDFYLHVVKPGETLYSISRAYNVLQKDIIFYNPDAQESIKAGEELKIPVETETQTNNAQELEQFIRHITEQGQTIYWLTRNYNITEEELYRYNPELANAVLQAGQVVRIPRKTDIVAAPENVVVDTDTIQQRPVVTITNPDCFESQKNDFRIAMFLPLFIDDNFPVSAPDSTMTRDAYGRYKYHNGRYWISPRSANALEFYQGAMIAVDSLKKQGINAKIDLFDTMHDAEKMTQLLNNDELKNTDLMIAPFGPSVAELVDLVSNFSHENRIYCVSPTVMNASSLRNNPYLIQVNSGEINTVAPLVNHIASQKNIHITLIGNHSEPDQTLYNAYLNRLKTVFADSIFTAFQMSAEDMQQPATYLKRGKMNAVIIPSAHEAFVNVVAGQLYVSSNNFQINVYGLAAWTKFLKLDLEYLHKLEFRYATTFYIDYNNLAVRDFLKNFNSVYHTEPTMLTGLDRISPYPYQFAFLGYDVAYFFLSALKKFGENFGNCIPEYRVDLLQSEFHFERIDQYGGYRNSHFNIYKYNRDYTIVKDIIEVEQ